MSFCLSPEGDDAMPVLKPDRAHGLQARRGEGHELIEEDAAVRVASAFRHELKATPRALVCGIMIPHTSANLGSGSDRMTISRRSASLPAISASAVPIAVEKSFD
jgi:hypothetical protein